VVAEVGELLVRLGLELGGGGGEFRLLEQAVNVILEVVLDGLETLVGRAKVLDGFEVVLNFFLGFELKISCMLNYFMYGQIFHKKNCSSTKISCIELAKTCSNIFKNSMYVI
jgi:hypothetical protein